MSVERRGKKGVYYMKFEIHGKRIYRSTGMYSRKDAEQVELQERVRMEKEFRFPEDEHPVKMLLSEAIERTYKEKWVKNSDGVQSYNRTIRIPQLIGDRIVSKLNNDDITALINKLKDEGLEDSTVNRYSTYLRTVLNLCLKKWGAISKLPYIKLLQEPEGRLRIVSNEEEAKLVRQFKLQGYPDMVDLLIVLIDTGARLGNILRLEYKDVNFKAGMIHFWKTKQKKPYSVPMTKRVREILIKRQSVGIKPFIYTENQVEKAWRMVKKAMGLENEGDFVPHCLRHTCASRLVEKGIDLLTVKEWLGHSSYTTTLRYAHFQPKKLMDAAKALDTSGFMVKS